VARRGATRSDIFILRIAVRVYSIRYFIRICVTLILAYHNDKFNIWGRRRRLDSDPQPAWRQTGDDPIKGEISATMSDPVFHRVSFSKLSPGTI